MNSVGIDHSFSESMLDDERDDITKVTGGEEDLTETLYDIVPDPKAENVDLSDLRGVRTSEKKKLADIDRLNSSDTDLENLAELVPDVKARRGPTADDEVDLLLTGSAAAATKVVVDEEDEVEIVNSDGAAPASPVKSSSKNRKFSMKSGISTDARRASIDSIMGQQHPKNPDVSATSILPTESMQVQDGGDTNTAASAAAKIPQTATAPVEKKSDFPGLGGGGGYSSPFVMRDFPGSNNGDSAYDDGYPDSDHVLDEGGHSNSHNHHDNDGKVPSEFMNLETSAQSVSTATQTHEVRMPMYLPTFKPATGCTNASDFIVRCFVARLRSGITVVKHGRSRWCKSRLRILHIHPDGRSLSWKPAEGEPTSSKRPPKLDLSTCLEVRHAWSPDPQNPMYTGTPILRQKCEAANAHKSFALIFKQRTVDITAVTADQCKVLMEGFSALCFRLQVAHLAGTAASGANRGNRKDLPPHARPMPEEDGVSTTASATLTNNSMTPKLAAGGTAAAASSSNHPAGR